MKKGLLDRIEDWFSDEEDPSEPLFDPVHVGGVVICAMTAIGGLYWLFWTLLVYEGGLPLKIHAALLVLFTDKTPADLGFEAAPYAMGAFEGWAGNLAALLIAAALLGIMQRSYREAAAASKGSSKQPRRRA